jgi:hypothetical protein
MCVSRVSVAAPGQVSSRIENAGLLCLCLNHKPSATDLAFDCEEYRVDDIYSVLKNHDSLH